MNKVLSKILDDENKESKWWNRNWLFAATVAIILINVLIFLIDNYWYEKFLKVSSGGGGHWRDAFYFVPTWRSFFSSFSHMNAEHIGLNDLIYNLAHYSSYFIGLVVTLVLKLVQLKTRWETAKELNEKISENKNDNNGADNV